MASKIKSLIVRAVMSGHGVVQFDGKDQKSAHNISSTLIKAQKNVDNINFAKACFFQQGVHTDSEGNTRPRIVKQLKISADGIRHAIHVNEHPFHTPNIGISPTFRIPYLANLGTLERGYLITDTEERKKSGYTITSALEVGKAVPVLEFHSRSGEKDKNASEDGTAKSEHDASDTTLHSRDSVGDTLYTFTALIDVSELGFISLSKLQDRLAVLESDTEAYRAALSANLGSPVPEAAYFTKRGSAYQIPEKGILLTDFQVALLVKDLLIKMSSVCITKSQNGYAHVDSVYAKAVIDPLSDAKIPPSHETRCPEGWTTVFNKAGFNEAAVNELLGSFDRPYVQRDFEEAKALCEQHAENKAARQEGAKKRNQDKAEKKAAAKTKKAEQGV